MKNHLAKLNHFFLFFLFNFFNLMQFLNSQFTEYINVNFESFFFLLSRFLNFFFSVFVLFIFRCRERKQSMVVNFVYEYDSLHLKIGNSFNSKTNFNLFFILLSQIWSELKTLIKNRFFFSSNFSSFSLNSLAFFSA